MKARYFFILFFLNGVTGNVNGEINYIPTGPEQSVAFEKALLEAGPEYVDGIFPKNETLNAGIRKNEIPSYWIQLNEAWLKRVLRPDFTPGLKTEIAMYGLPEFRWNSDYIVGYYDTTPPQKSEIGSRIEFQATDRHLSITIFMDNKISDVNALSNDEILRISRKYLSIPERKLSKISIEKAHGVLAGIPVCYGKMRCEFHELRDTGIDKEKNRRWWSYILFWITEDKFYTSVFTIDWEKDKRPAAANSRLFRRDTGKSLKDTPANTEKK